MIMDSAYVDSAATVAAGLPYASDSNIALVTDDSVCAAVIAAENELGASKRATADTITQAWVFDFNGTGYALLPADERAILLLKGDLTFVQLIIRDWEDN